MLEIQFIGEHLLPGKIGHFFVILSFTAALFGSFSYYKASTLKSITWNTMGRYGFHIHGISLFGIIGMLFYVMVNKMYEYRYAFEHVSDDLPMQYILSSFWEGQEGSFLLWMFWHVVLGAIIIWKRNKWEAPVMCIILLIQAFINSMILGVYLGFGEQIYKFGSNPTLLLRDTMNAPIFSNAEYLTMITGRGLNPLLQNYWNVIHPPVTFLGFASTTMPFAFAVAALWKKDFKEIISPLLKWGLFSSAALGIGILMGGAWAYEALSFGGYWAWDPVENMSLVPWLMLVAGVHTNVVANSTGYSLRTTFLFYILSFVLIIYSTFLTRSGILGETSAHAFTEMGLEWQLVAFVLFFLFLGLILFAVRFRKIPVKQKEESIYSKEFWMFIGAIVLFFSAAIIASSSSLPVFNKIITYFDPAFIGNVIEEPIPHYNKYQIWTSIFITILSGSSLFLRFRDKKWNGNRTKKILRSTGIHIVAAAILCYLSSLWINYFELRYIILSFCCWFGMVASLSYMVSLGLKGLKSGAAAFSHLGFAMMVFGVIASGLNTRVISTNPFAMKGLVSDESLSKVVTLIKDEPLFVNNYWINYTSDTIIGQFRTFDISFERKDGDKVLESFVLHPNVQYDRDFKKVAASNPDTKHYLHKDIFTNIASLPRSQMDITLAQEIEDSLEYIEYKPRIGDTIFTKKHYGIVKGISFENKPEDSFDLSVGVQMEFKTLDSDESYSINPVVGVKENLIFEVPEIIDPLHLKVFIQDSFFSQVYNTDRELDYVKYTVKQNELFYYKDFGLQIKSFNNTPTHKNYEKQQGDIAASALIEVRKGKNDLKKINPVYILRNNQSFSVKEYLPEEGLHVRFTKIDPINEEFSFELAIDKRDFLSIPIKIADDVPRSDFIVFEAKEFPGINLFWLGAILMLLGFILALAKRWGN